jgi:hypothetical protein
MKTAAFPSVKTIAEFDVAASCTLRGREHHRRQPPRPAPSHALVVVAEGESFRMWPAGEKRVVPEQPRPSLLDSTVKLLTSMTKYCFHGATSECPVSRS